MTPLLVLELLFDVGEENSNEQLLSVRSDLGVKR